MRAGIASEGDRTAGATTDSQVRRGAAHLAAAVGAQALGESTHWQAVWSRIDRLSEEVARVNEIENERYTMVCAELDDAKCTVMVKESALDKLNARVKTMVRERDQLVENAEAQHREIWLLEGRLKEAARERDEFVGRCEDQAARIQDLEKRNTALIDELESIKAVPPTKDGTEDDDAFEFQSCELVIEDNDEDRRPEGNKNDTPGRKGCGSGLELPNRQQRHRRETNGVGSEAWAAALIREFERKKPWNDLYEKRVSHAYTFDFSVLHPDAQYWVLRVLQYNLNFQRELWENQHWISLKQEWASLLSENARREKCHLRARNHWAQIEADGRLLIAKGLLSKNVFKEPFVWPFPTEAKLIPVQCETMEEVESLDQHEPARCFFVDKIKEHPFYQSEVFAQYPEKHPFFHKI